MIDLPTVTPYLFSLALLAVVLVLVALLLVPALVHLRWERRQRRRRY